MPSKNIYTDYRDAQDLEQQTRSVALLLQFCEG